MTNTYIKDKKTTLKKITPPLSPPNVLEGSPSLTSSQTEEEEEDLSQKKQMILGEAMVSLWNKAVQAKLQKDPVRLSKPHTRALVPLLEDFFQKDLAHWKAYCDRIAGCQFLMTQQKSGFQVNFSWATKPENIAKVLNGAYYDKPSPGTEKPLKEGRKKEEPSQAYLATLKERCARQHSSPKWFEICASLTKSLGPQYYTLFLKEAFPQNLAPENLIIAVPHPFQATQLEQRFSTELRSALREVFPDLKKYEIICNPALLIQEDPHV